MSSRSGSADVLAVLGVKIDGDADFARRCLREVGFAFCFAPRFHPSMAHVAAIRKQLGVPTIFNFIGPLANPAGVKRQLLGVGRLEMLDRMAGALAMLGTLHAFVLCSSDGLDEVSLSAATLVREVRGNDVIQHEWSPVDFGLESCALSELSAPHIQASAGMIKDVVVGTGGAAERIVLANAAVALLAADKVQSLPEGVERARNAITCGKAREALEMLRRLSGD